MKPKQDKRILIILVLKILEKTSENYPITHEAIANTINNGSKDVLSHELCCNRKTIGKYIKILKEAGYKIKLLKKKGVYMESNKLTFEEKVIIKNLVKDSLVDEIDKESILNKLC